jgi:hypothetical protein
MAIEDVIARGTRNRVVYGVLESREHRLGHEKRET